MHLYVATKAENYVEARRVMEMLKLDGHEITHDWTQQVQELGPGSVNASQEVMRACAMRDLAGVASCDAFVLIPYNGLCGALIEWGAALAQGKTCYVIGALTSDDWRYTIFQELYVVHHLPEGEDGYTELLLNLGPGEPDE